jgi:hypothetical protein
VLSAATVAAAAAAVTASVKAAVAAAAVALMMIVRVIGSVLVRSFLSIVIRVCVGVWQGDGHGLPKVLFGPAIPYPSMACGQATPETALQPFQGDPPAGRAACDRLLPVWTPHAVRLGGLGLVELHFVV